MTHFTANWAMPNTRSIFGWINSIFKPNPQNRKDQLDYEYLLRQNDHLLKDIGLTTDDVKASLMTARRWL